MALKILYRITIVSLSKYNNFSCNTMKTSVLVPPPSVRGMMQLDRDAFTNTVEVPCVKLQNVVISKVAPTLKKYLLKLRRFKAIQKSDSCVTAYLDPMKVETWEDITEDDRKLLGDSAVLEKIPLSLKYDNYGPDVVLQSILPENVEVPTGYTLVGHIAHLNLREEQLPYKHLIGQIYLDYVPQVKTVVNKVNTINNEYRNFSMEILVGEENTVTTVIENGISFQFDFAKVYWNSRLSTEHDILVKYLNKGDVLYDVFAGVGPFAVPAARKGVTVLANDLNPESYKWLLKNAAMNKTKNNITAFNKDGRDFLREDVKKHILQRRAENADGSEHIAMNLPAIAIEFLDVLPTWFNEKEIKLVCSKPPVLHLYCFIKALKGEDPIPIAKSFVENQICCELNDESLVNIRYVRNVAPGKEMMRVSFRLSEKMLGSGEPERKKAKIDNSINVIAGENGEEQSGQEQECVQSGNSS